MAVITWQRNDTSPGNLLRITGGFVAAFSLLVILLVLFVIPGACSFVGGIQLFILGLMFVFGVLAFLVGTAVSWRKRKG